MRNTFCGTAGSAWPPVKDDSSHGVKTLATYSQQYQKEAAKRKQPTVDLVALELILYSYLRQELKWFCDPIRYSTSFARPQSDQRLDIATVADLLAIQNAGGKCRMLMVNVLCTPDANAMQTVESRSHFSNAVLQSISATGSEQTWQLGHPAPATLCGQETSSTVFPSGGSSALPQGGWSYWISGFG